MSMPIVNMNGDNVATLIRQQYDVQKAAQALREALARATPHGRNYQINPNPEDYRAARERHMEHAGYTSIIEGYAKVTLESLMRQNVERNGDKAYEIVRDALHPVLGRDDL